MKKFLYFFLPCIFIVNTITLNAQQVDKAYIDAWIKKNRWAPFDPAKEDYLYIINDTGYFQETNIAYWTIENKPHEWLTKLPSVSSGLVGLKRKDILSIIFMRDENTIIFGERARKGIVFIYTKEYQNKTSKLFELKKALEKFSNKHVSQFPVFILNGKKFSRKKVKKQFLRINWNNVSNISSGKDGFFDFTEALTGVEPLFGYKKHIPKKRLSKKGVVVVYTKN